MGLLDAQPYDEAKARRRTWRIITVCVVIAFLASIAWIFRHWPQERIVDHFFNALQKQDYAAAYGIWMHDPQWQQHPGKYKNYPYNEFYRDWGPGGEWGLIKSHRIYGALAPSGGSGVVVEVIVNDRAEHARVWVEQSDSTMTFSPY